MLAALHRVRFALWALRLRAKLRRHGIGLELRAPHGARFRSPPHLEVVPAARGGTVRLVLGRNVRLGRDVVLEVLAGRDNTLQIGDRTSLEAWCRIQLLGGEIVLGEDVHVRDDVLMKTKSSLRVGDGTVLSKGVIVHATAGVEIGPRSGIGERTSVIDSDHTHDGSPGRALDAPLKLEPIRVGANVLVGVGSSILRGARVGDNSVVAAGAVVLSGEHEGGWLHAGVPAKPLRPLAPEAHAEV